MFMYVIYLIGKGQRIKSLKIQYEGGLCAVDSFSV